ncbi:MAG: Xaa-Pro peptidase family protein [Bulleidia sp.]|nr:Xaa-Pro peptidase family protein [Bulleidia sp.]
MLNSTRLTNVIEKMTTDNLLITDPLSVAYLCGKLVEPGERFFALLIGKEIKSVLFLNQLFRFDGDLGLEVVYYKDTDQITDVLKPYLDPTKTLGVDKIMQARFLVPMMEEKLASQFKLGSLAVDKTRSIKDAKEQELMRAASHVNDLAMAKFKELIHEGVTELEVASKMLGIYQSLGASGYSFEPIVAFGKNAADPHHMPDDTVLQEGDTVLFDVGCIVNGYCSDMTRTFFYKKYPNQQQVNIYNLVRQANENAEAYCKAGVRLCDIDSVARDIITEGGYGEDFTHRLGHFIGTQTHEYGDVSQAYTDLTEVGNTFSIEPGIYHPSILGCRIEDLVLITENGCEVLNHYPHDIEVIE